jgi:hypothetical protein
MEKERKSYVVQYMLVLVGTMAHLRRISIAGVAFT